MGSLKSIVDSVKTIQVGGEPVSLRLPPAIERSKLVMKGADLDTDNQGQMVVFWDEICAKAMTLCVTGQDDMTEEDWQVLISASRDSENPVEGLPELVTECLRLCGFDANIDETDEKDAIDEATGGLGESHS